MAVIKRHKRKLKLQGLAIILFSFSLVAFILSNLFIGSFKAQLMIEIQNMTLEVEKITSDNNRLNIEIQTLQNKDRVYTIAQDAGLQQNQDNVVGLSIGE